MDRNLVSHHGGQCNHAYHPQLQSTLTKHLLPLRAGTGHISIAQARTVTGQAQRLAQVVPEAQPWAGALWAALTGATQASEGEGKREAPLGRLPARRFAIAARWFLALLEGAVLPIQRVFTPDPNPLRTAGPI